MTTFDEYVQQHGDRFVEELKGFVRQRSIAAHDVGMREMASLVLARLRQVGMDARLIEVRDGAPVVYGEIGDGPKTLLVYNHYDVQPPDPLGEWETPPFEPDIRDGKLFGRGVADDKAQLLYRIQAIEGYLATVGPLPLKIKFVIEGEEEIGSLHLGQFVAENRGLLESVHGCLWEYGGKDICERPQMSCGQKGIVYLELHARGAVRDIHSASGTIVENAAWRLVWALSTLKDANDRILIDGFEAYVRAPNAAELRLLDDIPFEEEKMRSDLGISQFINDLTGAELLAKHLYEPTCTICGMDAGYTGSGTKTVLPSRAIAKIDFRLVPNLTPDLVIELLRKHLDDRGFHDIQVVRSRMSALSARLPIDSEIVQAAVAATIKVSGTRPVVWPTSSGSGPMYVLCEALGIPAVSAGCAWYDSRIHAPNESIRLIDYFEAIQVMRALIDQFSQARP